VCGSIRTSRPDLIATFSPVVVVSKRVRKVKPMRESLLLSFFLMASRGRLCWPFKSDCIDVYERRTTSHLIYYLSNHSEHEFMLSIARFFFNSARLQFNNLLVKEPMKQGMLYVALPVTAYGSQTILSKKKKNLRPPPVIFSIAPDYSRSHFRSFS